MLRWVKKYDNHKTDPGGEFSIPSIWHSTKFPLENMTWNEIRYIELPELGLNRHGQTMNFGEAICQLKQNWYKFKRLKSEGDRGLDVMMRILKAEKAMGIQLTEFRNAPPLSWFLEQIALEEGVTGIEQTSEDLEVRFEEEQDGSREDIWSDDESLLSPLAYACRNHEGHLEEQISRTK